jgi:hypothetical protein
LRLQAHDSGEQIAPVNETKNEWVIRKHICWGYIVSRQAEAFDEFCRAHSIRI